MTKRRTVQECIFVSSTNLVLRFSSFYHRLFAEVDFKYIDDSLLRPIRQPTFYMNTFRLPNRLICSTPPGNPLHLSAWRSSCWWSGQWLAMMPWQGREEKIMNRNLNCVGLVSDIANTLKSLLRGASNYVLRHDSLMTFFVHCLACGNCSYTYLHSSALSSSMVAAFGP